jgi:hypothetical protein
MEFRRNRNMRKLKKVLQVCLCIFKCLCVSAVLCYLFYWRWRWEK